MPSLSLVKTLTERRGRKRRKGKDNSFEDGGKNDNGYADENEGVPTDEGWSWIICFCVFIVTLVQFGHDQAIFILFVDLVEEFQQPTPVMTSMFTIFSLMAAVSAVFTSNFLMPRFDTRQITLAAAGFGAALTLLVSLSPNVVCLLVFFGMKGVCFGAFLVCPSTLLGFYFKRYRSLATAIANSGLCAAFIIFPVITDSLRAQYGLRDTLRIIAAIEMHLIPVAMLLRPVESYKKLFWKKMAAKAKLSEENRLLKNSETECFLNDSSNSKFATESRGHSNLTLVYLGKPNENSLNPGGNEVGVYEAPLRGMDSGESGENMYSNNREHAKDKWESELKDYYETRGNQTSQQPPNCKHSTSNGSNKLISMRTCTDPDPNLCPQTSSSPSSPATPFLNLSAKEKHILNKTDNLSNVKTNKCDEEKIPPVSFSAELEKRMLIERKESRWDHQDETTITSMNCEETSRPKYEDIFNVQPDCSENHQDPSYNEGHILQQSSHLGRSQDKHALIMTRNSQISDISKASSFPMTRSVLDSDTSQFGSLGSRMGSQVSFVSAFSTCEPYYTTVANNTDQHQTESLEEHAHNMELLTEKKKTTEPVRHCCRLQDLFDFSLLAMWPFRMVLIANALGTFTSFVNIYMPTAAVRAGLSRSQAASLVTIVGAMDFFSRLVLGYVADLNLMPKTRIVAVCLLIICVLCQLTRFYVSYTTFVIYSVCVGLTCGCRHNLLNVILIDHVGLQRLGKGLGLCSLVNTLLLSTNHPVIGVLLDVTGSFIIPFHIVGAVVLCGAVVFLCEPLFLSLETKRIVKKGTLESR